MKMTLTMVFKIGFTFRSIPPDHHDFGRGEARIEARATPLASFETRL
jgi:hypothetical protein